ncbi:MAG: hypothetical protein WBG90_18010 [Saonia sp.]
MKEKRLDTKFQKTNPKSQKLGNGSWTTENYLSKDGRPKKKTGNDTNTKRLTTVYCLLETIFPKTKEKR